MYTYAWYHWITFFYLYCFISPPHECMERLFADTFCILAVYANEEQTLKRFV